MGTRRPNPDYDPRLDEDQWLTVKQVAERLVLGERATLDSIKRIEDEGIPWHEEYGSRCNKYNRWSKYPLIARRKPKYLPKRKNPDYKGDFRVHVAALPDIVECRSRWFEEAIEARAEGTVRHNLNRSPEMRAQMARAASRQENRARGEQVGRAVLFESNVRDIRKAYANGRSVNELRHEYGVSWNCIKSIVDRKTWAHVED